MLYDQTAVVVPFSFMSIVNFIAVFITRNNLAYDKRNSVAIIQEQNYFLIDVPF